jgi:transposase
MLRPDRTVPRIYLYRTPIDMRRQRNGLAALVQEAIRENPFDGSIFVFVGKRFDRIKMLHWDVNGFVEPSTQDPRCIF